MRSKYALSSLELNDKILSSFEHLTNLLGYSNISGVITSGVFDLLDRDASESFSSGILYFNEFNTITTETDFGTLSGFLDIGDFLKFDYIYRKYYESEV